MFRMKCVNCERMYEVLGKGHNQVFCGTQCFMETVRRYRLSPYKLTTQKTLMELSQGVEVKPSNPLCVICSKPFIQEHHNQIYCSGEGRAIMDSLSYRNRKKQLKARGF